MTEISVTNQFTRTLGGRYMIDGPGSGEQFREQILLPGVRQAIAAGAVVTVNFDGVAGMPTSFLEEAFGGLIRRLPEIPSPTIIQAVQIVAPNSPRLWPFCNLAREYMTSAAARRKV